MRNATGCIAVTLSGILSLAAAEGRAVPRSSGPGSSATSRGSSSLPPSAWRMHRELTRSLRQWADSANLVGERQRQRLEVARFHLANDAADGRFELDPVAREETEYILRSVALKLLRERFEQSPPVADLLSRFESGGDRLRRRSSGWSLRISPRFELGNNPHLGANFSLRRSRVWSRFTAGFRQHFERDDLALFLHYEDDRLYIRLKQELADDGDDSTTLSLRWQF